MICSIDGIINKAIANSKRLPINRSFTLEYLVGTEFYNTLSDAEIEYIEAKFHQLVIQQQILGIEVNVKDTKDPCLHQTILMTETYFEMGGFY